ncbi:hypothetical protein AXA84_0241 [Candidatus Phytoplasma oryzae]|uniref:Uncharacterized protein n=1 Tax=Candidatus Phytoplasma oryzae TaxID=203274 RepID=A0A139JQK8_9MOLU|nr:hypothetical protein [Candidatus Phytoplasma oryzae]KXT29253.1 hypothetical protein AXA84_0241 [Candidatus Phytoplasma oryzae]
MYLKRQEIIQSFSNMKTKIKQIKDECNYIDSQIIFLEKQYKEHGQKFASLFGKLEPNFKNLNSFKETSLDIQKVEEELKKFYEILK